VANPVINFDNEFLGRDLANKVGLHQGFSPVPYVQMLLHGLVLKAQHILPLLPMMEPIPASLWNTAPNFPIQDSWFFNIDNQAWGNNAEASSSRGPRGPRLQFIRNTSAPSSSNQNVHDTLSKGRDIFYGS
jgi:hypothetical protein